MRRHRRGSGRAQIDTHTHDPTGSTSTLSSQEAKEGQEEWEEGEAREDQKHHQLPNHILLPKEVGGIGEDGEAGG